MLRSKRHLRGREKPTSPRMNWKYPAALIGLLLACTIGTMVQAAGPSADYEINSDYTVKSPDDTTTVEQYDKTAADGDLTWQFWARRPDSLSMLQPEQPDYAAGFRFTTDSRWLVRMQKTGSGEAGLYLYKLGPQGFVAATAKPFSDLAWNYFKSLPNSRKIRKPDFHIDADLVKGIDDNYHQMGENWPDSRYLIITLSGDVLPISQHGQISSLRGWHCRYDLQTGRFDVPPDFAENNAKAIAPPPK